MKSKRKLFQIEFDFIVHSDSNVFSNLRNLGFYFYVIVLSNQMNYFHLNGVYEVNKHLNTHFFDIEIIYLKSCYSIVCHIQNNLVSDVTIDIFNHIFTFLKIMLYILQQNGTSNTYFMIYSLIF